MSLISSGNYEPAQWKTGMSNADITVNPQPRAMLMVAQILGVRLDKLVPEDTAPALRSR